MRPGFRSDGLGFVPGLPLESAPDSSNHVICVSLFTGEIKTYMLPPPHLIWLLRELWVKCFWHGRLECATQHEGLGGVSGWMDITFADGSSVVFVAWKYHKITKCFINSVGRAPLSAWPCDLSGHVIDLTQVGPTVRNKTFNNPWSSPKGWVGRGISLLQFPSILKIVLNVFPTDSCCNNCKNKACPREFCGIFSVSEYEIFHLALLKNY